MELGVYKDEPTASAVVDRWTELRREGDTWMNRLSDLRKYLFSPDTQKTDVNKNNWKNNTRTPKITQIYDNLLAQYMAALFPNDSWISFEGNKTEDMNKESLVEQYLRHKVKECKFKVVARQLLVDWIFSGMCCAGIEHVREYTNSIVNPDEKIVKYHGSKPYRVSPYDYVIEARAPSFEDSVLIVRKVIPRASLFKEKQQKYLKYNEETLDKARDITGWVRENSDSLKDIDLSIDGFSTPQDYFQSGMVELFEFWGDFYNKETGEYLPNHTIGIIDRMGVLWDQPNPMWNGQRPYSVTGWRERPDNLYAQGPLELILGMQYRIDHLENAKADVLDLTIHPRVDIFGDIVDDYELKPGAVNELGQDAKVQYNSPDTSVLQLNSEIYNYMELMEEIAGSPKQTAGLRTPGEKTAFEVDRLNEGAMKLFLEKTAHFEFFLQDVLNNFYTLSAMYFDVEDTFRVLNDTTDSMEIIPANKADVIRDGNFKLRGSENYKMRNKLLIDVRELLTFLMSIPATAQHFDSMAINKMFERELDLEQFAIVKQYSGLTEQVDGQMVMEQHSAERQKQAEEMGMEGGQVGNNQTPPQ